jgi:hypothetical protein
MRRAAFLVVLLGCHHAAPPAPVVAHEDVVPELSCPPPTGPSKLRGVDPRQGGYLVGQSDADLERWRAAMASGTAEVKGDATIQAMWAAFDDLKPEIQRCMIAADGTHPELHYELRSGEYSNSVATLITGVSVRRIDGVNSDHTPKLAPTAAEPCVRDLLTHVVLPSGTGGIGEGMTLVRQDFCTPTVEIAMRATRSYVDAFMTWWHEHPSQTCPSGLADLQGYGREDGKDPWHRPYEMRCDATGFEVVSGGPDRRIGTADDLASHR